MDLEQRVDALAAFVAASHWRLTDLLYRPELLTRIITCPLCKHASTRDGYVIYGSECQFGGGHLERYGCPDCDLVFGPLKMLDLTEQQLATDYRLLYEGYREVENLDAESRAFLSCDPQPGGRYLNWGCGAWSGTVEKLRADGWDVWGYEPTMPSANPFIVGDRSEISAKFDGIFSNNVIEHMRDPIAEFDGMAGHMSSGGVMVHATPCYALRYEHTRFHTAFYLGRSVEILAQRTGLEVVAREQDGEYESVTFRRTAP